MCKINDFNNTKKYIKLSTTVTKALMHNDVLSRRASSLWFVIYSLSYHLPSKSLSIYQEELAHHLGVNLRTVSRCVRELVDRGFLSVRPINKNDIYCINIYECSLPDWLVEEVNEEANVNIGAKDVQNEVTTCKENCQYKKGNEWGPLMEAPYNKHPKNEYRTIQPAPKSGNIPQEDIERVVKIVKEEREQEVSADSPEENVVQKDINFIYIKTQCMNCEYLQNKIEELERKLEKDMVSFRSDPTFETIQIKNRTESELLGLRMELKRLEKERKIQAREEKSKIIYQEIMKQMEDDPKLMVSKMGKREISGGLWWWIRKKLYSLGVKSEKMALTINEIIFSVRFGSLATLKYSAEEMPLMRSINVALKLVKEKRWQTPANFHSKVESLCAI